MSLSDLGAWALRRLDPETAHGAAISLLAAGAGPRAPAHDPALAVSLAGLDLPNCLGLAAGFDKDARAWRGLLAMGFGFVECGTVTPLAQIGNPRPRLFRLVEDAAVINRMGFNNRGLEAFAARLAPTRPGIVGANVGANKDSPDRARDYALGVRRLAGLCDYFTLNVSSPNTPGLRDLQGAQALDDLLGEVDAERRGLAAPVFLKVAPDLDERAIETLAQAALRWRLDGLIVSNTTVERPQGLSSRWKGEAGGLSGRPLFALSTRILATFRAVLGDALPLIGAGGVEDGGGAYAKIRAGASAIQIYSTLALFGPSRLHAIRADLSARLRADGFSNVAEAVGSAA